MKTITVRDREKEMSMMSKVILSLLIILVWCPNSFATKYYVSKQGNDENSGTSWATAWATVSKVTNTDVGGDTVFFGTGIFRGQLRPYSGTESAPTVYACSSWTQGITEIWGSDSVTGWTQYSGNVYKVPWVSSGYLVWGANDDAAVLGQKDGTYDTLLRPVASIAAITAAGLYFHDQTNDTLYAWRFGDGDPDNSDMEASGRPTIMLTGQDWVEIWGFKVRYGHYGGILFAGNWGANNHCTIERCYVTRCGTHAGENACSIGALGPVTPYGTYNVIRACTVGYAIEWHDSYGAYDYAGHLSKGMNWYATRHLVVESCVVIADNDGVPRGHTGIDGKGWAQYHTYRFNTVYSGYDRGISVFSQPYYDSVYGNIVIGDTSTGTHYSIFWGPGSGEGHGHCVVLNNTVYGFTTAGIEMGEQKGWDSTCYTKYNVIHGINNVLMQYLINNTYQMMEIDSNMYYSSGTPTFNINDGGVSWSAWQDTYGFDSNGTISTDPGFDSVDASNPRLGFARSGASNEMSLIYGGRDSAWTVFGAVQPDGPVVPDAVDPVISNVSSSNITSTSAVITWSTNEPANSQVEYGLDASYGLTTTLDPTLVYSHSVIVSGLDPSTTYHFRVISSDGAGNQSASSDYSFTTDASDITPPVITDVSTTNITNNTAVINWTTNEPANSQVEYGLDAGYGLITSVYPALVVSHSILLSGLDSVTTYHFRVISSDESGNQAISQDYSFTTDSVLSSVNLAEGIPPTVSGSYDGYSPIVLTDGNLDPFGGTSTTWASNESSTSNHWVVIDFGQSVAVGRAVLYWAYNDAMSAWMTSQDYEIQSWNGSGWDKVADVISPPSDSLTITVFSTVNTSRIRILQSVNGGPQGYPTVIWMTEQELISGSADTTAPSRINDLRVGGGL